MQNDDFNPEQFPPTHPEQQEGSEYTERWDEAFKQQDFPEFNDRSLWLEENIDTGEAEEELKDHEDSDSEVVEAVPAAPEVIIQDYANLGNSLDKAGSMVGFGFDTASRLYGIGAVLQAVMDVDETDRDAENPLGAVYERIATTPEARLNLYYEINKDNARIEDGSSDLTNQSLQIGLAPDGEFYERNPAERQPEDTAQASTEAIQAMKRLLEMLETSEIFADLRASRRERYDRPRVFARRL